LSEKNLKSPTVHEISKCSSNYLVKSHTIFEVMATPSRHDYNTIKPLKKQDGILHKKRITFTFLRLGNCALSTD